MDRVHGDEPLVEQRREPYDLLDVLARRSKEEPQAGDEVDTAIKQEASLILGGLAPCERSEPLKKVTGERKVETHTQC